MHVSITPSGAESLHLSLKFLARITKNPLPSHSNCWQYQGVKVSMNLPEADVDFLDAYAREQGFGSRSAVLRKAVRLLRALGLDDAYEDAWNQWESDGEEAIWDKSSSTRIDEALPLHLGR